MKIGRNNYEAFFLDFHEGNLSEEVKRDVLQFVESNPDLKEEFESFEIIFIDQSQGLNFPGKENLKKNAINVLNYKTWLVAYIEDDLNGDEKLEVEKFLSANPAYGHELEILRKTKIFPDYSIRFSQKSSLKKGGVVIPMWVRYAAAASLIFGLMAYFFVQRKPATEFVQEQPANKISAPVIEPANNPVAEIKSDQEKIEDQKPSQKKSVDLKVDRELAGNDSVIVHPSENAIPDQPLAQETGTLPGKVQVKDPAQQTTIVINEGKSDTAMQKLVVLDDNDLAELGLNTKPETLPNSILADAVNGAGKLFNINAHYDKSKQQQSQPTETWALGPLKIKRTVSQ